MRSSRGKIRGREKRRQPDKDAKSSGGGWRMKDGLWGKVSSRRKGRIHESARTGRVGIGERSRLQSSLQSRDALQEIRKGQDSGETRGMRESNIRLLR